MLIAHGMLPLLLVLLVSLALVISICEWINACSSYIPTFSGKLSQWYQWSKDLNPNISLDNYHLFCKIVSFSLVNRCVVNVSYGWSLAWALSPFTEYFQAVFFFSKFVWTIWMEAFTRTESPLSRTCCVGPVLEPLILGLRHRLLVGWLGGGEGRWSVLRPSHRPGVSSKPRISKIQFSHRI